MSEQNGLKSPVVGMYEDYFLDYASYVILERAVPAIDDGLKPVQRRTLHALREMHDGRYHKVANVIGQTMQFHPHGDAAIGDALVKLGQKDLLIDPQGNWGDVRTGDRAAASRYIEARLTKFALDIAFNPKTTEWQLSYDGRNQEPVALPMKFPLVLAQGVEGIAVGLSTRILPHNFQELLKAAIKILQDKRFTIYPDFPTGGIADVSEYQKGERGGKVKVRARIEQVDKKTLAIRELPYGVTTQSLIDSILKANDKGKIKIKKVTDNTAKDVEILIELASGMSPQVTEDALYAFTNCEAPISVNACVIVDNKPMFLTVDDILRQSTFHTKDLLQLELEIALRELQEKWHFASLEKIFIQKRIYRRIEECESWEEVLEEVEAGLREYIRVPDEKAKKGDDRLLLLRDITADDISSLTEIRIRRISKYNVFKADERIADLEESIKQTKHDLAHLTDYTIAWFEMLLEKYGKDHDRKTELRSLETIQATEVVANNTKLYANLKEGFIGSGLKKDSFICDCSDIDDIIVFRADGKFVVTRIDDKVFVGKNILHVDVWKKNDERTTYHLIYLDGKTGRSMVKRFQVHSITRDREYDLTTGEKGSKVLYFTANPNGESETVDVQLTPGSRARVKQFDFNFAELDIKGRRSKGNILTKYPVRRITQKEVGRSTLGALQVWMDEVSGRLNNEERGRYLGAMDTGDQLLAIYKEGSYEVVAFDMTRRFDPAELVHLSKFETESVISAVYYDASKKWTLVKRFQVETSSTDQRFMFISEQRGSGLYFATTEERPRVEYTLGSGKNVQKGELEINAFIDVKGWKSLGNKLSELKLRKITLLNPEPPKAAKLKPGDTVELSVKPTNGKSQGELF